MKILFIGSSGIGKTTMANMLDATDMDNFGFMRDGKWTICLKCLKYRLIDNDVFFGICHNLTEVAKLFDMVVLMNMHSCMLYSNILRRHNMTIDSHKQRKIRSLSRIKKDVNDIKLAFMNLEGVIKCELDCNFTPVQNMRNISCIIEVNNISDELQ